MQLEELIQKINAYSALARQRELTEQEKAEREQLWAQYRQMYKNGMQQQLKSLVIVRPDGSKTKLKQKK